METVLIANRKGGVGKTLIAVTLAAALARRGHRVALADADRQRSSLDWLARRPKTAAKIRALDWGRADDIGNHPKKLDWLLIDAPGALKGSKAETLIGEAKAVLAPVQPSFFDVAATMAFLSDIEDIKRIAKGKIPVHLIVNRARPRSRAVRALTDQLTTHRRPPLATLSERSVYGALAEAGLSVFDRDLAALSPVRAQWMPILGVLDS